MPELPIKPKLDLGRIKESFGESAGPPRAESIPKFPSGEAGNAPSQEEAHAAASDNSDAKDPDRQGATTGEQGEDPERTVPEKNPFSNADQAQGYDNSLGKGADAVSDSNSNLKNRFEAQFRSDSKSEASVGHHERPMVDKPDAPDPVTGLALTGLVLGAAVVRKGCQKVTDYLSNRQG